MQTKDVIDYTDSDGHQRRVVVGDLLNTEETEGLLQNAARKAGRRRVRRRLRARPRGHPGRPGG